MLTIRISATDQSVLTAHELLEDFADATEGWQYLNEVSTHYTDVRGAESCVLRHWNSGVPGSVDVVFSGTEPGTVELTLVAKNDLVPTDSRSTIVTNFAEQFDRYLESRPTQIQTEQLEPAMA